jgi:hypothetical protein
VGARSIAALLGLVVLAGCGGEKSDKPTDAKCRTLMGDGRMREAKDAGCPGIVEVHQSENPPLRVAGAWVRALNDRDFARACELSVRVGLGQGPCLELLQAAFADHHRDVEIEGAYFDRNASDAREGKIMTFSLSSGPDGFSAGAVERRGGQLLVHWEAQLIRYGPRSKSKVYPGRSAAFAARSRAT